MGRKTRDVTIKDRGEDKTYVLTEMPCSKAEKWAIKVFLALARSGVEIPDDIAERGMAGIATLGFTMLGGIDFDMAEPLLDEMFECVAFRSPAAVRPLTENDIEDVQTRLRLRAEVFELHTGFSVPGIRSGSASPAAETIPQSPPSPGTRIYLRPSGPSSATGSHA
jgi:hypothetical protein